MSVFVVVLCSIVVMTAVVLSPLLLPWPQHLRWIVASSVVFDPFSSGSMFMGSSAFVEVTVRTVDLQNGGAILRISGTAVGEETLVCWGPPSDETVDRLLGWQEATVPLVLFTGPGGDLSLHGSSTCMGGLRRLDMSESTLETLR